MHIHFFALVVSIFIMQKTLYAENQPTPPTIEPTSFSLLIPHIGNVIMQGSIDLTTEDFAFTGSLKDPAPIKFGPLSFSLPTITFSNNQGISLETDATLFGKKALLKSKQITLDRGSSFDIQLPEALNLPISPWKTIAFNNLSLYLDTDTKTLSSELSIFSEKNKPDATLSYLFKTSTQTDDDQLQLTFTNVGLNSFIPHLAPSAFKNVSFESLICTIQNCFTIPTITMEAKLQTAALKSAISLPMEDSPIQFQGSYNKTNGFSLTGTLKLDIPLIPKSVILSSTEFNIKHTPEAANTATSFSIQSTVLVQVPGIKDIECIVSGSLADGSIDLLEGAINTEVNFQGITLNGAKIRIKPSTQFVEIVGTATIMNSIAIEVAISIENSARNGEAPHPVTTFSAKAAKNHGLKPFHDIPGIQNAHGIKDIALNNLEFSFNSDKTLEVSGECTIFKTLTKARVIKTIEGTVLIAKPLQNLSIDNIIPNLKKTPFHSLKFPSPEIIATSFDFFDTKTGLTHKKGFSLSSTLDSSCSFLSKIHTLIPSLPKKLDLTCPINPNTPDINFSIALPSLSAIKLDSKSSLQGLSLSLTGKPTGIDISIKGRMLTWLPMQKHSVFFSSECEFSPNPGIVGVTIKGTMLGDWDNVFTIPGITLSNVALELGASFIPGPPFIIPKEAGFTGELALGNKLLIMGTKLSTDGDYLLYGELDGSLNMRDLIRLANKMGAKLPLSKFPKELAEIKDVLGKIATTDTTIGDIYFSQGVTFRGAITLFNQSAMVDFNIDTYGITAAGSLPPIIVGKVFKLTGDGIDGQDGDNNKGVAFRIALTPTEQCIYFSGKAEIFKVMSKTDITISPEELFFKTKMRLFGLVDATITGKSTTTKGHPDFLLQGEYNNGINLNVSKDDLRNAVNYLSDEIKESKQRFNAKLSSLETKIKDRHELLKRTNKRYRDTLATLDTAQGAVDKAEDRVKNLDDKIQKISKRLWAYNQPYAPLFLDTKQNLLATNNYNNELFNSLTKEYQLKSIQQTLLHNDLSDQILLASTKSFFKKASSSTKNAASSVTSAGKTAVKKTEQGINKSVNSLEKAGSEALESTKKGINKTLNAVEEISNEGLSLATEAIDETINTAKEIAVDTLESTKNGLEKAVDTIETIGSETLYLLEEGASEALDEAKNSLNSLEEIGTDALASTKKGLSQALENAKTIGEEALEFVEDQSKWTDLAELAALKIAREAAVVALEGAKISLTATKEACKNLDHEILTLRLQQAKCSTEFAAETAGLETAKGIVAGAVASYPAVTWLSKIYIKKAVISGSMRNPFPKIRCDVRAFNKFDGTIELNCNPMDAGNELIKRCFPYLKGIK